MLMKQKNCQLVRIVLIRLKNEYPELGKYEVTILNFFELLDDGRLTIEGGQFKGKESLFTIPVI
jgi:hypothetical protein